MKKSVKEMLAEAAAGIKNYDAAEAMERLGRNDVVFVDVRDEAELAGGTVPGAVHASRGMLEFLIDPDSAYHKPVFAEPKEFIFYCKSGARSTLAARCAREMGLERVACLKGGLKAWAEDGGRLERPGRAAT